MPLDRRAFLTASAAAAAAAAAPGAAGAASTTRGKTRVWEIGEAGGFDTMRLVERELRAPARDEVLVEVSMSAIAARDQGVVRGWFLEDKEPTRIPLSEGVGTIVEVGEDVTHVKPGDRVCCVHFARWVSGPWSPANYAVDVGNTVDGWLGQRVLLPASGCATVPESISDTTAATLTGSAITAWHALNYVARVKPGDTVLSLGTGGVSSWGTLLASAAGARVAVTSSSDEKLGRMRELGADITVNYRKNPEWGLEVFEKTGGVNVVLENVGRATLDQSMQACDNNATIVMIGTGRLPEQLPKMPGFYMKNLTMKAISNGSRQMLEDLIRAVAANGIEAAVGRVFPFDEAVEAFKYVTEYRHIGKILIDHGT